MDLDDAFDQLLAEANQSDEEEKKRKKKQKKKEKKKEKKEKKEDRKRARSPPAAVAADDAQPHAKGKMIEIFCNDRLGNKVRVKCHQEETIGNVKKIIAAQSGHRADKIRLQKWYNIFKDNITLGDYEIHDGMSLEMHYN